MSTFLFTVLETAEKYSEQLSAVLENDYTKDRPRGIKRTLYLYNFNKEVTLFYVRGIYSEAPTMPTDLELIQFDLRN